MHRPWALDILIAVFSGELADTYKTMNRTVLGGDRVCSSRKRANQQLKEVVPQTFQEFSARN